MPEETTRTEGGCFWGPGWGLAGVYGGGLIFHQSYLVLFHLLNYVVYYRDKTKLMTYN